MGLFSQLGSEASRTWAGVKGVATGAVGSVLKNTITASIMMGAAGALGHFATGSFGQTVSGFFGMSGPWSWERFLTKAGTMTAISTGMNGLLGGITAAQEEKAVQALAEQHGVSTDDVRRAIARQQAMQNQHARAGGQGDDRESLGDLRPSVPHAAGHAAIHAVSHLAG